MSSDRDVTRIVLDQVLDQLPTTPQRRAWWPARRLIEMNNVARLAIAAAAVVVIAFLGIRFLVPGSNSVGGPGATPTPTAVATPTPTPAATPTLSPGAAVPLPSGGGAVLPGRYLIDVPDSPVSLELTVADAGWSANGWYLGGGSTSISFWTVANVYANACVDSSSPEPPIGPTVDDLVAALDAQVGTDMQSFFNPDVGGYPATRVIMLPTEGVDCLGDLKL
jgi:hypothetical protein